MKKIVMREGLPGKMETIDLKLSDKVHLFNGHAMIENKITVLRDKRTPSSTFRTVVEEITILMSYQALGHLPVEKTNIETPVCPTESMKIAGKKMVLVPILRAGDAMEPPMKKVVPQARTGHCGVYRDKETLKPVEYYWKMPDDIENRAVLVLDPMLATGGSIDYAISKLKKIGCKTISVMSIIAAPQGVDLIQRNHPDVELYIAHLDEGLNEHGYIVPGLGDAGDRIFGTK